MTILDMEFFYFPAYQELSTSEKIHARKALNNVCDQVLYSLVINKSGAMLSREECEGYKTIAKELEPSKIDLVRSRYVGDGFKKSILTDIEEK